MVISTEYMAFIIKFDARMDLNNISWFTESFLINYTQIGLSPSLYFKRHEQHFVIVFSCFDTRH